MALMPDVAVVQEVTEDGFNDFLEAVPSAKGEWVGEPKKRGIAVFGLNDWRICRLRFPATQKQFFLPVEIRKGRVRMELIAVWAKAVKNSHENSYIGQVHDFLESNRARINESTIVIGDFNANAIWDSHYRKKTFSAVRDLLKEVGQESAYHHHFAEPFGKETRPTFFLQKNLGKGYHIDYCFVSRRWKRRLSTVEVLSRGKWAKLTHSDHRPLVLDFAVKS